MKFQFFSCFLFAWLLVSCVGESSENSSETNKNALTPPSKIKTAIDLPKTVENATSTPALLISRTFDEENFTLEEGVLTVVYALEWKLLGEEVDLGISAIVLKKAMPFDFTMTWTDPLDPCEDFDTSTAIFRYVADGQNTALSLPDEPFRFFDCAKCLQRIKLQYKEGTYSDAEVANKLFPNLNFKIESADSVEVPDLVHLAPIHVTGDSFIEGVSRLTQFMQSGLFTHYGEEKESGQGVMEFDFEVDWKRAEQGKVIFRDIQVDAEGERKILTEMNWAWEIKGPGKIALFDQNGDRYDVLFTSTSFSEDIHEQSHIQFEWKGKKFVSQGLSPCP